MVTVLLLFSYDSFSADKVPPSTRPVMPVPEEVAACGELQRDLVTELASPGEVPELASPAEVAVEVASPSEVAVEVASPAE